MCVITRQCYKKMALTLIYVFMFLSIILNSSIPSSNPLLFKGSVPSGRQQEEEDPQTRPKVQKLFSSTGEQDFPFSRWGDDEDNGIDINAIIKYLEWISTFPEARRNPLLIGTKLEKSFTFPNVLYIFGCIGLNHPCRGMTYHKPRIVDLYTSAKLRNNQPGFIVRDRAKVQESLFLEALDLLFDESNFSKWQRLREVISYTSERNCTGVGLPILLNLEDYRYCSHANFNRPSDSTVGNEVFNLPIFSLCADFGGCNFSFPIPTYKMIEYSKSDPSEWDLFFTKMRELYPWEDKIDKAVWRGSLTGGNLGIGNTRENVVKWADNFPRYIDAKVVTRKKPQHSLPFESFQDYKAIIDIDGNSWSERFSKLLCLNSVVLKVEPEFSDYFMPILHPWKHYIPIHRNLSNLVEIVKYIGSNNNTHQIKQIIDNANIWCRKNMIRSQLAEDMLNILSHYVQELDKANPTWQEAWTDYYVNRHNKMFDMQCVY